MKLDVNDEEFNILLKNKLLTFVEKDVYQISLKPDTKHDMKFLNVNVSSETQTVSEVKPKKQTVDTLYKDYMTCFPNDINKLLGLTSDGVSLRTGKKDTIITRLKARISEGIEPDDILNAVRYEVWYRTKSSLKKQNIESDNDLQYMQRAEAWINNTVNLDTMIQRSKLSTEYNNIKPETNGVVTKQNTVKSKIL